jgi:glycerophosphoryl diester phosphodiesterase
VVVLDKDNNAMTKGTNSRIAPWIVAHRGARTEAPENTRAAFDAALTHPVDGIEMDVQMSRDQVPVLFHDRTLAKITGGRKRIADYAYSELSAMNWGGWHSGKYRGELLLTLEKALQLYSKKTCLFIEIKSRNRDRTSGRSSVLTTRVLGLIRKQVPRNHLKNIFLLSFDPEVLRLAYSQWPGLNYVLNLDEPISLSGKRRREPDFLYAFCAPIRKQTGRFVEAAHRSGRQVMTYSCNISRQADKALELGLDVIMTDRPGWLVTHLHAQGSGG